MSTLNLQNISKNFGPKTVLRDINLEIREGEFFSILGPSGCGKTTILRILAGFEAPSMGSVEFRGESLLPLPAHLRPANTVFQNYALFPHMSVFDNVAFGLKIRKVGKPEIQSRVQEMLELVNLRGFGERSVPSLSGGEKQRVALARALINRPAILLLDEPLSALDLQLRKKVQFEIREIHRRIGATFIYVTHDQEEALAMSDRIAVMEEGRIEQVGTPQEIYDRPTTRFVAKFIGSSNLLEGTILERMENKMAHVEVQGLGPFLVPVQNGARPGDAVGLLIRPEKIELVHDNSRAQGYEAVVEERLYLGPYVRYRLMIGAGHEIFVTQHLTAQRNPFPVGQKVRVRWAPQDLVLVEK